MKKLIFFIIIPFFVACGDGDANVNGEFIPNAINIEYMDKIPESLQQDSPFTYSQIMQISYQMYGFGAFMENQGRTLVSGAKNDYVWSYGDFEVSFSYNLNGNQYEFLYSISYQSIPYYTIEGWEMADGSMGAWNANVDFDALIEGTSSIDYNYSVSWSNSNSGFNYEMSMNYADSFSYLYILNINSDGSGEFEISYNDNLMYEAIWNSDGSGQLINHNYDPPVTETWG